MIIDERMSAFIDSFDTGNTPELDAIENKALEDGVPIIRKPMQKLLKFILAAQRPTRILEVGTAVGFSALLMREYAPKGCAITTIENYEPRILAAKENFRNYPGFTNVTDASDNSWVCDRFEIGGSTVDFVQGDATDVLKALTGTYDIIFMDAAKGQYINWIPEVLRLMDDKGMLISDNVLQDGEIIESRFAVTRRNRTIHSRMRDYLYELTHMSDYETVILPVGDGATLTIKRS